MSTPTGKMSTPTPTGGKQKEYTFLIVGPTRSGKSSMINAIFNKNDFAQEGNDEEDSSTTSEIKTYSNRDLKKPLNSPVITFIDTIGFFDTRQEYTDEDIQNLIKAEFLSGRIKSGYIDAVFVIDSLLNDFQTITNSLIKMKTIFGEDIL